MSAVEHVSEPKARGLAPTVRDRLARPVILVYWLVLAAGLGLYAYEAGNSLPLWVGAIAGTVLGHCLALRDLRLWFVTAVIGGTVYLGVMLVPPPFGGTQLWLAFVPAVLCAYASLSDRWSLAAIWFPAVIWMLTILDRTHGTTQVDAFGAVLLGGVAIAFVVFLRARESRRVGMWTRVAATPLAEQKTAQVLRDMPSAGFLRAGWTLGVTAITFAVTAWLAPKMWKLESVRHQEEIALQQRGGGAGLGIPCCPLHDDVDVTRTRVREYLDLGRGHDERDRERDHDAALQPDCQICPRGGGGVASGYGYRHGYGYGYYPSQITGGGGGDLATTTSYDGGGGVSWGAAPVSGYTAPQTITRDADGYQPVTPAPTQAYEPVHYPPQVAPQQVPTTITPPVAPAPVPPPRVVPPLAYTPHPAPVHSAPTAPPATTAQTGMPPAAAPAAVPPRTELSDHDSSLLHWLVTLLAGAVIFQLVGLALRPLRRALTLRHLRSPLWAETVDQRVSNSWQLALVGLRDAGWRTSGAETPLELARRVKIVELETCATILERTRYGIQLDDGDLAAMSESADAAYDAARAKVGSVSRAISQLRWPLA